MQLVGSMLLFGCGLIGRNDVRSLLHVAIALVPLWVQRQEGMVAVTKKLLGL